MSEPKPQYSASIEQAERILESSALRLFPPAQLDTVQVQQLRRHAIAVVRLCDDLLGQEQTIPERKR